MMSAQKLSVEAKRILSLYRTILRLHQKRLPEVQRELGDRYVKQEFRAHITATPEQRSTFTLQWTDYVAHLTTEADIFGLGRDLAQDHIDEMTEDQHGQLQKILKTTEKIAQEDEEPPKPHQA